MDCPYIMEQYGERCTYHLMGIQTIFFLLLLGRTPSTNIMYVSIQIFIVIPTSLIENTATLRVLKIRFPVFKPKIRSNLYNKMPPH